MRIPIENIYYLLCYAWDKLEERDKVNVAANDYSSVIDLFAKILINSTKILLKRGIDKNYIEHSEEIPGIKGKLMLGPTLKRNSLFKQRTYCTFDNFSVDILPNNILFTTIHKLIRIKGLDKGLQGELLTLYRMLDGITLIELDTTLFKKIKLNRNNHFYGFILNVCQIIFENLLPSEDPGMFKFSDFTKDEDKMNKLFESFVRNFYRVEQKRFNRVGSEIIDWNFTATLPNAVDYLPIMKTDITLENDTEKIIIDAKYYSETMVINYGKERIKSGNLYQLFSYLSNQYNTDVKTINAKGILLYPTIEKEYNLEYKYKTHSIAIRTVNLNQNWKDISIRLKEIIGSS